ncbi:MAG: NUDIX hydrolase [Planctomycetes bacterium]|nr:NUDIX hydrolase [Planctomycetota bacterium]
MPTGANEQDRILAEGRYLRLVSRGGWEFTERRRSSGVVVVIVVTADAHAVLTEQFRPAVGRRVIDWPSGLAGDTAAVSDEPLHAAAARELEEETGYRAGRLTQLWDCPTSPGLTSEIVTYFLAEGLQKVTAEGSDTSESITVHEVPLDRIDAWLTAQRVAGAYIDPKVYAGLYLATRQSTTA